MNYFEQHHSQYLDGLRAFLRIPSVSTLSEHKSDIHRANGSALRASPLSFSTDITTFNRLIPSMSGNRRHSSPRSEATISSRAAQPTIKARSTSRSKPWRAC